MWNNWEFPEFNIAKWNDAEEDGLALAMPRPAALISNNKRQ